MIESLLEQALNASGIKPTGGDYAVLALSKKDCQVSTLYGTVNADDLTCRRRALAASVATGATGLIKPLSLRRSLANAGVPVRPQIRPVC